MSAAVHNVPGGEHTTAEHSRYGRHRYNKDSGRCTAGCPGPWPCTVAITLNSGDSTPPRPETER